MRKRLIVFFDIVALAGFGAYMAMTIWRLPEPLRDRLLTTSLSLLTRLTIGAG
ncbi:hypothetical protein [Solidesulfovibrio aerotolerans]|uniref:hypothetical protein n=1 Tax=Solidesulfovibrio aerotolerans TaxID=295255 RepID=UPI0014797659|nr:hypothetical protein [Solidesulfovibrio aerotolerans]